MLCHFKKAKLPRWNTPSDVHEKCRQVENKHSGASNNWVKKKIEIKNKNPLLRCSFWMPRFPPAACAPMGTVTLLPALWLAGFSSARAQLSAGWMSGGNRYVTAVRRCCSAQSSVTVHARPLLVIAGRFWHPKWFRPFHGNISLVWRS